MNNGSSGEQHAVLREQASLLFASVIAKRGLALDICRCVDARCRTCLQCLGAHCLCAQPDRANSRAAGIPTNAPEASRAVASVQEVSLEMAARAAIVGRPRNSTASTVRSGYCVLCSLALPASKLACLYCEGCTKGFHPACLQVDLMKVPEGAWFCAECFPEGQYVYYPLRSLSLPSPIERARVIQILTESATALSEEQKVKVVEDYIQRIGLNTTNRFLVLPLQKLA